MNFFNLKKLLTKILQNIRRLPNYYNLNGGNENHPTSANISSDNSGSVIHFLSTAEMEEGKPDASSGGNILHFNWDNEDTWASQLFIGHNTANIQHRIQGANGDWSFWQDVYKPFSSIPENADLNSNTYKDTHRKWYCISDARAVTLQSCPTNEAFILDVEWAYDPEYKNNVTQYILQTIRNRHGKVWTRMAISQDSGQTWNHEDWTNNVTGLGTAATKSVANNLTTATSGSYVLDAAQGKALDDKKLNKTGGTITGGSLIIDRSSEDSGPTARVAVRSNEGSADFRISGSSSAYPAIGVYDNTNNNWIVRHDIESNDTTLPELRPSESSTSVTWASSLSKIDPNTCTKTCRLFKIGNIVFITFAVSISSKRTFLPSSGATICTLPSGFRPKADTPMQAVFMRNTAEGEFSTQVTGTLGITAGGIIKQNVTTTCNAIYFSGFYEIA